MRERNKKRCNNNNNASIKMQFDVRDSSREWQNDERRGRQSEIYNSKAKPAIVFESFQKRGSTSLRSRVAH